MSAKGEMNTVCSTCGKPLHRRPSLLKTRPHHFCDKDCYSKWLKINYIKENNPSWNGGKIERICANCGKTIYKYSYAIQKNNFCDISCYERWLDKTAQLKGTKRGENGILQLVCENCGVSFYRIAGNANKKGHKFCSKDCQGKWNTKKGTVDRVCSFCGAKFSTYKSVSLMGKGKYCSNVCKIEASKTQVNVNCAICGKEFSVAKSRIEYGKGKICSKECQRIWTSQYRIGKNAANWQGGKSYEPYCEKFNADFKNRVRMFFNYSCVLCGKSQNDNGRSLSVHHVSYDKRVCCNDKPHLFVILCNSCHSKTGSKGKRGNWEDFFRELLSKNYSGKCYYTKDEYLQAMKTMDHTTRQVKIGVEG